MHTYIYTYRYTYIRQVCAALEGLQSGPGDHFHAAVDAVCELVWCTVDPDSSSVNPLMMPLIQVCVCARARVCVCVCVTVCMSFHDEVDSR